MFVSVVVINYYCPYSYYYLYFHFSICDFCLFTDVHTFLFFFTLSDGSVSCRIIEEESRTKSCRVQEISCYTQSKYCTCITDVYWQLFNFFLLWIKFSWIDLKILYYIIYLNEIIDIINEISPIKIIKYFLIKWKKISPKPWHLKIHKI